MGRSSGGGGRSRSGGGSFANMGQNAVAKASFGANLSNLSNDALLAGIGEIARGNVTGFTDRSRALRNLTVEANRRGL